MALATDGPDHGPRWPNAQNGYHAPITNPLRLTQISVTFSEIFEKAPGASRSAASPFTRCRGSRSSPHPVQEPATPFGHLQTRRAGAARLVRRAPSTSPSTSRCPASATAPATPRSIDRGARRGSPRPPAHQSVAHSGAIILLDDAGWIEAFLSWGLNLEAAGRMWRMPDAIRFYDDLGGLAGPLRVPNLRGHIRVTNLVKWEMDATNPMVISRSVNSPQHPHRRAVSARW